MKFEEEKALAVEIARSIKMLNENDHFEVNFDSDGGYIEIGNVTHYFDENLNLTESQVSL